MRYSLISLKTQQTILIGEIWEEKILIKRLSLPRFKCSRSDLITKRKIFSRKSWFMRK